MRKVIDQFNKIKNTSGTNDKKAIIKEYSNDNDFVLAIKSLLDGNQVWGISSAKISKNISVKPTVELNTMFEVIDYLNKNNSGRDIDIVNVKSFIDRKSVCEYESDFYKEYFTKKYKLGVDTKVVNSVITNLIPTHEVMLGTSIEKCKLNGNEWIALSHKLNGNRCSHIGDGILKSRQNKIYKGVEHISNDIEKLELQKYFIDGELALKNDGSLTDSEAFQIGTGIAQSKDVDKSRLKFVIFDIFPLDEWKENGTSKETYKERLNKLKSLENLLEEKNVENIEVVDRFYQGYDHSQIWKWLDYAEENDLEGIMINLDTKYESKRTKNLIKVKKFYTCDLKVIGLEEGSGRNKNTLGALVCEYGDNIVKVGSGFTDEQRKLIWEDEDKEIIGRVVEVKYKEKTKDKKTNKESLQFPVFIRVRELGKEVNIE